MNGWPEVWFYSIVPLIALVPIMDRLLGISQSLARRLNIKQPDFILLALTVILGAALIVALKPITDKICWGICDEFLGAPSLTFQEDQELIKGQLAYLEQERETASRLQPIWFFLQDADTALVLLCPFICLGLAVRQKRPVMMWFVWFVMGVFGTIGSVAWLIGEQRKNARLAPA